MFVNKCVFKCYWFENIEFIGECLYFFCYIFKSIIKILNKKINKKINIYFNKEQNLKLSKYYFILLYILDFF